jgi:vacuolar-type H+-ATPase subunit F/Vma7
MSRAAAIGPEALLAGYALAGVEVLPAAGDAAVRAAWEALPGEVELLILAPEALAVLRERLSERPEVLWALLT